MDCRRCQTEAIVTTLTLPMNTLPVSHLLTLDCNLFDRRSAQSLFFAQLRKIKARDCRARTVEEKIDAIVIAHVFVSLLIDLTRKMSSL